MAKKWDYYQVLSPSIIPVSELKKMGQDCWELVDVLLVPSDGFLYIFKNPM